MGRTPCATRPLARVQAAWLCLLCIVVPFTTAFQSKFPMETMYQNPSPTAPAPAPAPVTAPVPAPSAPDLIDDQQPSPPPSDLLDVTGSASTVQQDNNCVAALDFLSRIGGFNVLVNAVKTVGLERLFNSERAVRTILAPNDEAFVALLQMEGIKESQLLAQPDKLRKILLNHVILGEQVRLQQFEVGSSYPTANTGEELTAVAPVQPFVVASDLQACNTLIQDFSVVLVPSYIGPLGGASMTASTTTASTQTANSYSDSGQQTSTTAEVAAASSGTNAELQAKYIDVSTGTGV